MLDWLYVLLDLWLIAGIVCFIAGAISAIFPRRNGSGLWVLPFYLFWMLPIYLIICVIAGIWWLWDKLFKSEKG